MNSGFTPAILPEHETPECASNCSKCELSRHGTRMVWGEGNPFGRVMVFLDNPGAREDREGQAYVCGTRDTLQYALHITGIDIDDIYVTYLLKCRPVKAYDKENARKTCMAYLDSQLNEVNPRILMCLGDVAVQNFFKDPDKAVKAMRGKVYNVNGKIVLVSYHPLAVRRRPNLMPLFLEDWRLLKLSLD